MALTAWGREMENRELHQLEAEWRSRFGEPLPLRTEPDLIRRILDEAIQHLGLTPEPVAA